MKCAAIIVAGSLALLLLSAGTSKADCDAAQTAFIDQTVISQGAAQQNAFENYLYQEHFQTHDEAIKAGIAVGVPVYGVPLQIGGTFDKTTKDAWYQQHQQYAAGASSVQQNFFLLQQSASPVAFAAWAACNDDQAVGLKASLREVGPELLLLKVNWMPTDGDNKRPKLKKDAEAQGAQFSAGNVLKKGYQLKSGLGVNTAILSRKQGATVVVNVVTDRGNASATAQPYADPPVIESFAASPASLTRGETVTIAWQTKSASTVSLDGEQVGATGSITRTPATPWTYTLKAANSRGASVLRTAPVVVSEPITVSNLGITFRTGDDDKDDDTGLSVSIGDVTSWSQSGNELFKDQSTSPTKPLNPSSVALSSLSGQTLKIAISPNGNDTWKFGFTLAGTRSDGKAFNFTKDNLELSENTKEIKFPLP